MDKQTLQDSVKDFDDDIQYREIALKHGLRELACLFDGLDTAAAHTLSEFSADNHFAHLLWRGHDPAEAL